MTTLFRTPSFRIDGRRALVTGAARGIGLGAATALAAAGAHVTLSARTSGELTEAAEAIRLEGHSVDAFQLDVTDLADIRRQIGAREPYDILVNNAGTNRPKPMTDVLDEDFDVIMNLNVRSAYFLTQAVVRRLLAEKRAGSIINISSNGTCRRRTQVPVLRKQMGDGGLYAGDGPSNSRLPEYASTRSVRPSSKRR